MFEFFSLIFAQMLMKFCWNFADNLENVEFFWNFWIFYGKIPENSNFERIQMVRMVRMVRSLADRTFQLWCALRLHAGRAVVRVAVRCLAAVAGAVWRWILENATKKGCSPHQQDAAHPRLCRRHCWLKKNLSKPEPTSLHTLYFFFIRKKCFPSFFFPFFSSSSFVIVDELLQ